MKTLSKPLRINASFCKEDSVVCESQPKPSPASQIQTQKSLVMI